LKNNIMRKYFILIVLLVFVLTPAFPLRADVIITKDDMILNGKILEDKKPEYIKFANYHGNFTIKYKQIKEIRRTESFEGDIKVLQQLGKTVNENEIKNNYQSGERKLKEQNKNISVSSDGAESFVLMCDVFFNKNFGKISSVLPYGQGGVLSGEIPLNNIQFLKKLDISGIDSEVSYFYSEKDEKYIKSLIVSAGPLWRFPVTMHGYAFNFNISALIGAGWFYIKNGDAEESAVKSDLTIHAGPAFDFFSVIISPQLRIDYIYDGYAPLLGVGVSLGAGYNF